MQNAEFGRDASPRRPWATLPYLRQIQPAQSGFLGVFALLFVAFHNVFIFILAQTAFFPQFMVTTIFKELHP